MFKWAMQQLNMENLKHPGTPNANYLTQSVTGDDPFEAGNHGQYIYLSYKHLVKRRIKTVYIFHNIFLIKRSDYFIGNC